MNKCIEFWNWWNKITEDTWDNPAILIPREDEFDLLEEAFIAGMKTGIDKTLYERKNT